MQRNNIPANSRAISIFFRAQCSNFIPPVMQIIAAGDKLDIGGCRIDVLHQDHGNTYSLAFF